MSQEQQKQEMPPGFPELWENVTHSRMDIAELKGMIKMHFKDGVHHQPPCATAAGLQKTLYTAMGEMRRRKCRGIPRHFRREAAQTEGRAHERRMPRSGRKAPRDHRR